MRISILALTNGIVYLNLSNLTLRNYLIQSDENSALDISKLAG